MNELELVSFFDRFRKEVCREEAKEYKSRQRVTESFEETSDSNRTTKNSEEFQRRSDNSTTSC